MQSAHAHTQDFNFDLVMLRLLPFVQNQTVSRKNRLN